jgi:hypothetical protein
MFRMFHMIRMIYMPGRSGRSSRPIQSNPSGMVRLLLMALVACIVCPAFLFGCSRSTYIAERATRAYPAHLHNTRTLDVQVFREGTDIRIVNTSPISFASFDLWLNKRYVRHIDALPAGETIVLSLWDFYDHRGEVFNAGGFFASYDPTPLRMTQIQLDDETPMIGLVTIRSEPADG